MLEEDVRIRLVNKITDLKDKISENERLPHQNQDLKFIFDIEELIDNCLNNWYY